MWSGSIHGKGDLSWRWAVGLRKIFGCYAVPQSAIPAVAQLLLKVCFL